MFYNEELKKYKKIINEDIAIKEMMREACIGNVSEIYDAEEPRKPNGTIAQAWSVSEILRIMSPMGQRRKYDNRKFRKRIKRRKNE